MSINYTKVEAVDLGDLAENDSVQIIGILGSFKRVVYEIDVFKVTDDHVYGIALVSNNIPEREMLEGSAKQDPDSLREEYVRLPRHGQLRAGEVRIDILPFSALAEDQPIESIDGSLWTAPHLGTAALGFFRLPGE